MKYKHYLLYLLLFILSVSPFLGKSLPKRGIIQKQLSPQLAGTVPGQARAPGLIRDSSEILGTQTCPQWLWLSEILHRRLWEEDAYHHFELILLVLLVLVMSLYMEPVIVYGNFLLSLITIWTDICFSCRQTFTKRTDICFPWALVRAKK